jgi:sugar lactone lactonase YvrE
MRWTPLLLLLLAPLAACSTPNPDRFNTSLSGLAPIYSASRIEVVGELPVPPGNLAVSASGRVFLTLHPEAKPKTHLVELAPDGTLKPFPDAAWQEEREDQACWVSPLGVRIDSQDRLWVLDHGDYGRLPPSLTAFDIDSGEVLLRHVFAKKVAGWGSMLNDLAVDAEGGFVYIADPGPFTFHPGLVVFDIEASQAWRALDDHISVVPEDHHHVVQGRFMRAFYMALQIGVDSIALSPDGSALLYGPLSGASLYLIPTSALRDRALDPTPEVRTYGPKPTTDGIAIGPTGDVYLTAIEHDALAVLRPTQPPSLELLVSDPELLAWPDGLALSKDGSYLYATVSELHHVIGEDLSLLPRHAPYRVVRVRLGNLSSEDAGEEPPPAAPADEEDSSAPGD